MLNTFESAILGELNLVEWCCANNEEKKSIMLSLFGMAQETFGLDTELSFVMPEGFELAFGLSNPATGKIYINETMWDTCDVIQPLYTMLHEMRHSIQSSHPELFPTEYELNSRYVIQFDGTGYKVEGNNISEVKMNGEQEYFTELYLASPCERDANAFAYRCLKAAGAGETLEEINDMWSPKFSCFREEDVTAEFMKAVSEIERLLANQM